MQLAHYSAILMARYLISTNQYHVIQMAESTSTFSVKLSFLVPPSFYILPINSFEIVHKLFSYFHYILLNLLRSY